MSLCVIQQLVDDRARARRSPGEAVIASTTYAVVRLTYNSAAGFEETRARFEERVPLLEPSVSMELVLGSAPWAEVEAVVKETVGPTGLVALTCIDSGALLSLSGQALDAVLYLVGNPLLAREITAIEPVAALYAPFRVAVYRDTTGVQIAYDQPSSVLGSLRSPQVDEMAAGLDDKIRIVVEESCQ
jgi:uncharacterized protein (DUF302 family)